MPPVPTYEFPAPTPVSRIRDWYHRKRGRYVTDAGQVLYKLHSRELCQDRETGCVIHAPSDHALASAPTMWHPSLALMLRRCEHKRWHPDRDDMAYKRTVMSRIAWEFYGAHECDGCCGTRDYR